MPECFYEGSFESTRQEARVRLLEGFSEEHWPTLEHQQQAWLDQGLRNYVLDLTCIQHLTSRVIGLFIGLNARMSLRGGRVRLIMLEGSRLAGTIHMMRLHKLMDVETLRTSPDTVAAAPAPTATPTVGEEPKL